MDDFFAELKKLHHFTVAAAFALFVGMMLATALAYYQPFARSTDGCSGPQTRTVSVVVMPFHDPLEGDLETVLYSEGMAAAVTTSLATIPNLQVAGLSWGEPLLDGVAPEVTVQISEVPCSAYVIEGSVQVEGHRVRVIVGLLQLDNRANLWMETYERERAGFLGIREAIVQAIARDVRVPLAGGKGAARPILPVYDGVRAPRIRTTGVCRAIGDDDLVDCRFASQFL